MSSPNPNSTAESNKLSPVHRYITTHTPTGASTIHSSPPHHYHSAPSSTSTPSFSRSYAVGSVPANLTSDEDITSYLSPSGPTSHTGASIVSPTKTGANLIVVDIPPGAESQMHRTVSIDYSICVIGVVRMVLDGGDVVDLKPGDHVIQRGTMHKWINPSETEPARFVAVTLPCEPFEIPATGKMLEEEYLPDAEKKGEEDGAKL